MKRVWNSIFVVFVALAIVLAACGQASSTPAPTSPPPASQTTAAAAPSKAASPAATEKPAPSPAPKSKESAADFYKGKTVELWVGNSPGGGQDTWARMVARPLEKQLGARIIVRNEGGSSGQVALTQLRNKNDGLSLITVVPRGPILTQVFDPDKAKYDMNAYNWLGVMSMIPQLLVVNGKSGIKTVDDFSKTPDVKWALDTPESGKAMRARTLALVLNKDIKLISGYNGTSSELLAVMRGEVQGASPPVSASMALINSGDIFPLVAMEKKRVPELPNTPTIYEIKTLSPLEKELIDLALGTEVGRPLATTPGVPQDRVDFLKTSLKNALQDKELIDRATTYGEPPRWAPGEDIQTWVKTMLSMPPQTKAKFAELLGMKTAK